MRGPGGQSSILALLNYFLLRRRTACCRPFFLNKADDMMSVAVYNLSSVVAYYMFSFETRPNGSIKDPVNPGLEPGRV